jgi:protein TonB
MFEQAVLANENASKRVWTTCAGMTAQLLVVLSAALAPVIWPEVLPHAQMLVSLVAPGVPERQEPPAPRHQTTHAVPTHPFQLKNNVLLVPTTVPAHPIAIEDPPGAPATECARCVPWGTGDGSTPLARWLLPVGPPAVVRPAESKVVPPPTPAAPIRVRGGDVHLGSPVYRVEPIYPKLAIATHTSGTVKLEGIIGTDGRIRELRALSGNPLLVPAALNAVRQWIYEPTLLNGKPVEVIAPITVNFRLTQ